VTTADIFIALPLLLLAAGAVITLLIGAVTRNDAAGTTIAVAATFGAALWLLQTPPAVTAPVLGLSASGLSRLFGGFFCLLAAGVLCLSHGYNRERGINGEEYPATVLFTAFGMLSLASATNLMTLFLGLEAMSFGFYILVAIDLKKDTSGETGLKYLLPGALSAAFLAFGIALLYCACGTLTISEAVQLTLADGRPHLIALAGWGCLLAGISFKLSLVPAHLWTPDVYQGGPAPVIAFLSGSSKGAAILFLLLLLPHAADTTAVHGPIWGLALGSMLVGNLAALLQSRVRRLLAYSSIAQMGYVMIAMLSGTGGGYRAAAFYALIYGVITLAAFGAITVLERSGCGEKLDDYRGRGSSHPLASGVLTLALFALAGIPPTAGFIGKFLIFKAAIRSGEITLAVIGILLAAASVFYYLRIVVVLYMRKREQAEVVQPYRVESLVLIAASCFILLAGVWPGGLLELLDRILP
jgi:NADH-quinone oxidoreductase subunit N